MPWSAGSKVTTGSARCAESVVSGATERLNWTKSCAASGTSVSPSPGITCWIVSWPVTVNFLVIALGRPASGRAGTFTVYVDPRTKPGKSGWKSAVRTPNHA